MPHDSASAPVPVSSPVLRLGRGIAALVALALIAASVTALVPIGADSASAASLASSVSAANFPAGDIISDTVMFDSSTMSAASIQSFLNLKGANCKVSTGKLCLKSFKVKTDSVVANSYCAAYTGAASETAATIISKMSTACGVNPEVLLVTLQKEHSLVTQAGSQSTFDIAMSFGCSDSASCQPEFKGFFNQINTASQSFKRTPQPPFVVGAADSIQYAPSTSCGTKTVTIKNRSTARLYTYTPYVPDAAALAGHTDSCAQFGNLNFWTIFNGWFSFSVIPDSTESLVTAFYTDVLGRSPKVSEVYSKSKSLLTGQSAATVASGFFNSSEARTRYINAEFQSILHRAPSASSISADLSKMSKGTLAEDGLAPAIIGGTEYYVDSGSTTSGYVSAVYETVLGRAPSTADLASQSKKVASIGRTAFAADVWRSTEHNKSRANDAFTTYLGHAASDSQQSSWASNIAKLGYFVALSHILASAEYAGHASATFPIND